MHMKPHNMSGAVLSVHSSEHNSLSPCPPGGYFSDVTSSETRLQQSCQSFRLHGRDEGQDSGTSHTQECSHLKGSEPVPPNLSEQLLSFLTLDAPRPRSPVGTQHTTGQLNRTGDHPLSGLSFWPAMARSQERSLAPPSALSPGDPSGTEHGDLWHGIWGQTVLPSCSSSATCQLGPEPNLSDPVSQSVKEG